jgi:hypothetical protein
MLHTLGISEKYKLEKRDILRNIMPNIKGILSVIFLARLL